MDLIGYLSLHPKQCVEVEMLADCQCAYKYVFLLDVGRTSCEVKPRALLPVHGYLTAHLEFTTTQSLVC